MRLAGRHQPFRALCWQLHALLGMTVDELFSFMLVADAKVSTSRRKASHAGLAGLIVTQFDIKFHHEGFSSPLMLY